MLIRRELSIVQTLLRLAGILAIALAATLVWYLNPVRSMQRSTSSYVAPVGRRVTTPNVPQEILTDRHLDMFEPAIAPPIPLLFGRSDPFASIVPPMIIVPPPTPEKTKNDNAK